MIASDVAEMRHAIAQEKGEDDVWDLKYAAGGMVDIDFIAQYLQLVHAADNAGHPQRRHACRCSTTRRRLGVLAQRGRRIAARARRGCITT